MALESRALKDWLLVPVEAEPGEAVEDDAGVLVRGAFLVGVFDAEQELAARVAGEEPVEEGGAGAADGRSGEHTAEIQSQSKLVFRLLLLKKKKQKRITL